MQKQNKKDIKLFGLAITILLSLISIKLFRSGKLFYRSTTDIAIIFFALSLIAPRIILPIYKIFKLFGIILIWLVTNLLLILIFYLMFTPLGLFLRLIRKDQLNLGKTIEESYWDKKPEVYLKDRYTRQF